jgi:soluble lytic murein transglycosylase
MNRSIAGLLIIAFFIMNIPAGFCLTAGFSKISLSEEVPLQYLSASTETAAPITKTAQPGVTARYKTACELIKQGQFQEAVNILSKLARDKKYVLADYAQFRLANIFDLLGNKQQADKEYIKLTEEFEDSIFAGKAYYKLGEICVGKKDFLKAAGYFDKAAQINSPITSKDRAIYRAAVCYGHAGLIDRTIARYLEVCVYSPASKFSQAAKTTLKRLNFDSTYWQARTDSSKETTVKVEPEEDIKYRAAGYYRSQGLDPLAEKTYYDLIKRFPETGAGICAEWDLGFWFYEKGNIKEAYNVFGMISKNKEEKMLAKCLYWMAKSAEKLGRFEEAKEILCELAADFPNSYYGRRAREKAKLPVSSAPYITSVPTLGGDLLTGEAHFYKYKELLNAGLFEDAANEARQIILQQEDIEIKNRANVCLAYALHSQQKYHEAISAIERAMAKMLESEEPEFSKKISLCISYPKAYKEEVLTYSKKYGIDPYLVFALIREESRFDTFAVSRSRARGLTQIMPRTGKGIARQLSIYSYQTKSLFNPGLNIRMGAYYLSKLLKVFGGNKHLALASYNGGPGNVAKWLKRIRYSDIDEFVESIPLRETRLYVKKVLESYWQYKKLYEGG